MKHITQRNEYIKQTIIHTCQFVVTQVQIRPLPALYLRGDHALQNIIAQ